MSQMNPFENPLNYKDLLKKYMDHVIQCEGISFVDAWRHSEVEFTDQEKEELEKIETEIKESWK